MTMRILRFPLARVLCAAFVALVLTGCAATAFQREGLQLIDEGRYEEGLATLEEWVATAPRDGRSRMALSTQRGRVVAMLLAQAERARGEGDHAAAAEIYRRVLGIEPANSRASEALRQIEKRRNIGEMLRQGQTALRRGDIEGADRHLRSILALDPAHDAALALRRDLETLRVRSASPYPQLRSKLGQPVTLEFRDGSLKLIFEVLARTAGINFIFDKDVKPDLKATLFVRQVPIEQAVELLLMQNQLLQKVINDNTVLIYPNTPQKLKEYQDLAMRTFYMSNTDAKSALNLVKTILKTRDVFIDERLNSLTMRDTTDALRLAEKLLLAQDQPDPEVVLEVEVLEIARQRILDLGIQWPNTFTALNSELGPITLLNQLKGIGSRRIGINGGPVARINARDTDVNTLANPVIRVRNKEKARIHIGDRIPIVSTTSTPSTQGPVTTESITYLDIGLKIEVEPTIYLNDEVGIKILLEVSNSTNRGTTERGSTLVEVSTRNAATGLRLKDGETQVLAGLLRNDFSNSGNKIPGLGDIPAVGRLFGSNTDSVSKTELILSITPRIVRNLSYMSPHEMEFPSGTDGMLLMGPDFSLRQAAANATDPGDRAAGSVVVMPAAAPALEAVPTAPGDTPVPVATVASPLVLSWEGPAELAAGATADVALRVNAAEPLNSTSFQIAWDPSVLRIVEVSEGDLMNRDGAATSFSPRLDEASGRMFGALSRSADGGVTGEGTLLRLRVAALESQGGAAAIRLLTFSGIGQDNRLLATPLPPPHELSVSP